MIEGNQIKGGCEPKFFRNISSAVTFELLL